MLIERLGGVVSYQDNFVASIDRDRLLAEISDLLQAPVPRIDLLARAVAWRHVISAADAADTLAGALGFLELILTCGRGAVPSPNIDTARQLPPHHDSSHRNELLAQPAVRRFIADWYGIQQDGYDLAIDPETAALHQLDVRQGFLDVLELPLERSANRRLLPHLGESDTWNQRFVERADLAQLQEEVFSALCAADSPMGSLSRFIRLDARLVRPSSIDGLAGLVGFACLVSQVENAARSAPERIDEEQLRSDVNALLRVPAVHQTLATWYELPPPSAEFSVVLETASLHKVGTTSFILECDERSRHGIGGRRVALKCVIPRYSAVESIARDTAEYKSTHNYHSNDTPEVFDSKRRFIAMQFVRGQTLAEILRARRRDHRAPAVTSLAQDELDFVEQVSTGLCRTLAEFAGRNGPVYHLDLSPSNIIVPDTGSPGRMILIDWGKNYLLTERVGSNVAFRHAAMYIAPEVLDGREAGPRADMYSIGVIILEMVSSGYLTDYDLTDRLHALWVRAPGMARLIEGLLGEQPEDRLSPRSIDHTGRDYLYLRDVVAEESRVIRAFHLRSGGQGFGMLSFIDLHTRLRWPQVRELRLVAKEFEDRAPVDDTYVDYGKLARWARRCYVAWWLMLLSVLYLTAVDLGLWSLPDFLERARVWSGADFTPGQLRQNLPARVVMWSVAVIATTYYMNIFASISTRGIKLPVARFAGRLTRLTAVLLAPPILVAVVYEPRAWPVCSAVCGFIVVINNFAWLGTATVALRTNRERFTSELIAGERFVDQFKEWPLLMFFYAASLVLLSYLLLSGRARDVLVYMVLLAGIDFLKMYRNNCTREAPEVRGNLERCLFILRRLERDEAGAVALHEFYSMRAVCRVIIRTFVPSHASRF